MRFLVVTKSKHPIPPDMAMPMIDAFLAWVDRYSKAGKMEQVWGFAGASGGGGILNVNSLEEMDAIMAEFPFGPFSETECLPLMDLRKSVQNFKQAMQAMMAPAASR